MKLFLFLVLTLLLTLQWSFASQINDTLFEKSLTKARFMPVIEKTVQIYAKEMNTTAVSTKLASKARFLQLVGRKLRSLWTKFVAEQKSDSFIGRCFGVARKLKFAMPLILFKLGVIVTVLGFLTLFSLKTLGLLGLLVLFNVSGAMTKIAFALSGKHAESKAWKPPQNVHLHVHQTKDGNYELSHPDVWEEKVGNHESSSEDLNNLDTTSLYNKIYLNNLLLKNKLLNNGYINR